MKFLFCTIGSRGDVQPLLVLGRELRRRGHEVAFVAPPNFRDFVEREGFAFRAVGSDTYLLLQENRKLAEKNPLLAVGEQLDLVCRETETHFDQLLGQKEDFDLVISAGLALFGRSLADSWKVPHALLFYTLSGVPSAAHPPATLPIFGLPRFGNRLLWTVNSWLFDLALGPVLNRGRARHGLPEQPSPWHAIHQDRGLLVQDRLIGELPRDALSHTMHAPALLEEHEAPAQLAPEVLDFLELEPGSARRSSAIYVGFGSMPTVDRQRVVRAVGEFHARTGRRVVLFSAHDEDAATSLPPGVRSIGAVDHRALFPRVSVVVHHGGAGTLATALRAGTPQVLVPHIVDQFFHARRVHAMGLGPRPLDKRRFDGARLDTAVAVATDCLGRAEAARDAMRLTSGPEPAATILESWIAPSGCRAALVLRRSLGPK